MQFLGLIMLTDLYVFTSCNPCKELVTVWYEERMEGTDMNQQKLRDKKEEKKQREKKTETEIKLSKKERRNKEAEASRKDTNTAKSEEAKK
jgi:hypothetical protein